ncbi:uncharacterized protein LOC117177632 [Belonocnema kinseyi]|uniref:uncharacterized protein LOC117177632 n=1 Tax=Belonocnema kinseyi TaxID=2817044 RepID=UPI00143D143B|nr:uncharacterized protein LOC117177632 [Belonocnema kinseyi]XP_033224312.1 uncharacterized protein LOC117177632 [Belonocnema kinseyi]
MTKNSEIQTNGNGFFKHIGEIKKVTKVPNVWRQVEFNEWTFSLILFVFSLIIVVGKLAVNYGYMNHWPLVTRNIIPDALSSYQWSELHAKKLEDLTNSFSGLFEIYGWLMRASLSGLATMGFTWFIVYKDSNIPGINPPSPFRSSKDRFKKETGIPTNYLVGALNGLLIFFYMCL